jgi:DNA-directed RNA polymerase specialized sigma subunit
MSDTDQRDPNYSQFISEMNSMLQENDVVNGLSQRDLMNALFKYERDFKNTLLMNEHGAIVYQKFMEFILGDKADGGKENKLSIRPYFRERQDTFSTKVFPILKAKNARKLHRFRINYLFMKWAMDVYRGPNKRKLTSLLEKVIETRRLLCENNLPLACNRVALFKKKTPQSHLQYMDLVQDASKGLIEAIDKFVPPYKTVFRTTAIGRMTLNMSEDLSSTLVKLPPKDKRILYRARKAKMNNNDISGEDLQSFVNESFSEATAGDIEMIEAAANQTVSMSTRVNSSQGNSDASASTIGDMLPSEVDTESEIADTEIENKLLVAMGKLDLIEKKVLLMKSGEIYGVLKYD